MEIRCWSFTIHSAAVNSHSSSIKSETFTTTNKAFFIWSVTTYPGSYLISLLVVYFKAMPWLIFIILYNFFLLFSFNVKKGYKMYFLTFWLYIIQVSVQFSMYTYMCVCMKYSPITFPNMVKPAFLVLKQYPTPFSVLKQAHLLTSYTFLQLDITW